MDFRNFEIDKLSSYRDSIHLRGNSMTLVFTGSIGMEEVSPCRVKGVGCWRQSAVCRIMHASELKVNETTLDPIAPH